MSENYLNPHTRKGMVFFWDCRLGDPNQNPDTREPRLLPDGRCYVTPTSRKRWMRDFATDVEGWVNFVRRGLQIDEVFAREGRDPEMLKKKYLDVRQFGLAVPGSGAAQVLRGPLVLDHPTTIDPIEIESITKTRVSGYSRKEKANGAPAGNGHSVTVDEEVDLDALMDDPEIVEHEASKLSATMFPASRVIRYGLFAGFVAYDTFSGYRMGTTSDDLAAFYRALVWHLTFSRSTMRPDCQFRGLWIFDHGTPRGHEFDTVTRKRVQVRRVRGESGTEATAWEDYAVTVRTEGMPAKMTMKSFLPEESATWDLPESPTVFDLDRGEVVPNPDYLPA